MRKFFTFFLALAASIGMSWAKTTSVKFEAHGNEKTVEVEVPYTFWCDYENENGEMDLIIQELYALQYGGYCDSDDTPVASGNDAVTAGKGGYKDKDQFITISAPFEGKVTVTGKYWDYVDGWSEYIFDYNLTISIVNSGEDPEPEGDGKLTGAFTINESGDQIVFSKGNLQYRASTNTWQFAANQYDIIGSDNSNISDSYSGWIDMFGWGTGNNPTNSSTKDDDYSTFVDWGANTISNGGNEANLWRTLTKDEWGYLFNTRTDAASLFGLGRVNGVNGTIILPDNWVTPDGASFTPSTSKGLAYEVTSEGFRYYDQYDGHFNDNTYTAEQWSVMEQNGAVFLPAAGFRLGSDVRDVGSCGLYWSATFKGCVLSCTTYSFRFVSDLLNTQNLSKPGCGVPVRLVATSVIPTPTPDPEPEGDGKLNGAFTINESGDQIVFSKGNLQYKASTTTWRFAANQYNVIGIDNSNISDSYSGWIDLFGWGTGNNPTNSSTDNNDYSTFVDWGVNAISNGGNEANLWRTLTKDEWGYLFNTRTDAASLFGLGRVNGVNGTIILPDNWVTPDGASFTPSTSKGLAYEVTSEGFRYYDQYDGHFNDNTYTAEQWSVMEQNGAVFLPAAGYRAGTGVLSLGSRGIYWSDTPFDTNKVYGLVFYTTMFNPQGSGARSYGVSVRLVATYVAPDPGEATAIDNANANANAVKVIRNGQLLIERDGKTYTITGQQVK